MPEKRTDDLHPNTARGGVPDAFMPFMPEGVPLSADEIVSRLASGPVPPPHLVTIARTCRFEGLPLIEAAASIKGVETSPQPGAEDSRASLQLAKTQDNTTGTLETGLESCFERIFSILGERRHGQLDMARTVLDAFQAGGTALVEAGTGTGKSLAYLVPAVLFGAGTEERIIVSTHTRNLQEQLFSREMPIVAEVLGPRIRVARLMGRDNYICAKRVVSFVVRKSEDEPETALEAGLLAALSPDGSFDSLPHLPHGVKAGVLAPPRRCMMSGCGHSRRCPLVAARRGARQAGLLFVNHALILTDHAQGGSILGPYSAVVFDEAHHLERSIMEHSAVKVSRDDAVSILEVVRPVERDDRWKSILDGLEEAGFRKGRERYLQRLGAVAGDFGKAFEMVFRGLEAVLNGNGMLAGTRTRYTDGEATFVDVHDAFNEFWLCNNELCKLLKPVVEVDAHPDTEEFQQEIAFVREDLEALGEDLRFLFAGLDENSVFWLEWGKSGSLRRICGSPLEIGLIFSDFLQERCRSAVFTSATLAHDGSFEYAKERLGLRLLESGPAELVASSPFDYEKSCRILVGTWLGDPNAASYGEEVGNVISRLALELRRRMIVLFTSYRLCFSTADWLEDEALPGPMFVQGRDGSREVIAGRLRRSRSAVLLGVASFWEGVDFPGEELEVLVIPKLPFPVPTEPVIEARSERLRAAGEDPFLDLFLPEAILRLRQGIGRLIRRRDDRGIVILLDSRIQSKPYGRRIVSSLPSRPFHAASADRLIEEAADWFGS